MIKDLGPTLIFIFDIESMCANVELSTSTISNVISAKFLEAQTLVQNLYESSNFSI